MFFVCTTSAYHSKDCIGRYDYQDTRDDQVDQERNGGAQSTKTYKRWGSRGRKKQRWQLLTDTDGFGVWPNVSSWMRDLSKGRGWSRRKKERPVPELAVTLLDFYNGGNASGAAATGEIPGEIHVRSRDPVKNQSPKVKTF